MLCPALWQLCYNHEASDTEECRREGAEQEAGAPGFQSRLPMDDKGPRVPSLLSTPGS